MPEHYAWLTLVCVLCVLQVGWCRAADEDEHVHIKVRMPEVARKHKSHKPPQQHTHHKYHYLPHQYYHNLHKPYNQPQLHAQYPHQAAKHGHRAVRPTPLTSPMMSHNHHDMGVYGDESPANDMSEHLLYSPSAPQPIPIDLTPNYGPALFGSSGSGSNNENIRQQGNPSVSSMLTMPGGTQQLVQQMELMGALAAAAAAAGGGANAEEDDASSGGGVSETNTLLADDFLADLQSTYANGKYPTAGLRRKKKYRGAGLAEIGDAAAKFALNSPQQQQQSIQLQQQQQLQLMRQQYQQQQKKQRQKQQQQFFGVNHFMQQAKPQAQMLRATPVISNNNNNDNNYHNYRQHMAYKNKQQYNYNDIYSTATSDEDNDTDTDEVEDDGDTGDDDHDNANDNADDFDDEVSLFFSRRPPSTTALSLTTTTHNTANDYDDDVEQFGYNSHNMNNYFDGVEGDANVGVNSVSYQPTTAYGAYAVIPSTPATATQHKMRPYRQLQQQQHRYSATQPFGISGHQQHHITTAQPINVVGPTAGDFDDQQTPPTQPQPKQQQQHHKYPMSPRYKKRKNRVKGKLNRNRILTQ